MISQKNAEKTARPASFWNAEQDRAQFAIAVRRLKQLNDADEMLPLHFSLPTGRSIESLCFRVAHLQGEMPDDLVATLHNLAIAVSVPKPSISSYASCAPVLRAICDRLAMPRDQRRLARAP